MIGTGDQTSISLVRQVMMGEIPALLKLNFPCVDIHDCSRAHLRALIRPEAANRRFILSLTGTTSMEQMATNLRDDLR